MHPKHTKYQAIVHYKRFGATLRQVARIYKVGKSTVSRWVLEDPECRNLRRRRRDRKSKVKEIAKIVGEAMKADPFLSAVEVIRIVQRNLGKNVSEATVSRCRKKIGFRYKQTSRTQDSDHVDPSHPFLKSNYYDGAIALDECHFSSGDSTPRRGWALGAKKVPKCAPRARRSISLLLALDANGVVGYTIRSGAFSKDSYASFLASLPRDRIIIADNVAFHKSLPARLVAEQRNQTLVFTPPYCPWFNPTEFAFSKTKAAYRRSRLSGSPDFIADVRQAIACISADDCAAFFRHSERVRQIELEKNILVV